jgi:hypothetical protein
MKRILTLTAFLVLFGYIALDLALAPNSLGVLLKAKLGEQVLVYDYQQATLAGAEDFCDSAHKYLGLHFTCSDVEARTVMSGQPTIYYKQLYIYAFTDQTIAWMYASGASRVFLSTEVTLAGSCNYGFCSEVARQYDQWLFELAVYDSVVKVAETTHDI